MRLMSNITRGRVSCATSIENEYQELDSHVPKSPQCRICGRYENVQGQLCHLCSDRRNLSPSTGSRIFDQESRCAATVLSITHDSVYGTTITFQSDAAVDVSHRVMPHFPTSMRPLSGRDLCLNCGHLLVGRAANTGRHGLNECPASPIAALPARLPVA